jgi:hypothetical protein
MQQFFSLSEEHSGCSIQGAPTQTNTWYPQLQVRADLAVKVVFIIGIKQVAAILVTQTVMHSV